eukprot:TRINITY_DN23576_c0_g1_i1.p1 TRINITY_DN23576_c0_g1~~TRINITY_DN23576_c0_g1_i1.p1  ORF type:complete len:220 (-),score=22.66 TRINITY_DN23576_c0_g1_i1:92-751(-)
MEAAEMTLLELAAATVDDVAGRGKVGVAAASALELSADRLVAQCMKLDGSHDGPCLSDLPLSNSDDAVVEFNRGNASDGEDNPKSGRSDIEGESNVATTGHLVNGGCPLGASDLHPRETWGTWGRCRSRGRACALCDRTGMPTESGLSSCTPVVELPVDEDWFVEPSDGTFNMSRSSAPGVSLNIALVQCVSPNVQIRETYSSWESCGARKTARPEQHT